MMEKKMSVKAWCKEYAPDMGYTFVDKNPKQHQNHYVLIKNKKAIVFGTLNEVRAHILRDLQRHISKHTVVVER